MLASKRFEKKIIIFTAVALIFSIILIICSDKFSSVSREDSAMEYPIVLFSKNIVNIDIEIPKEEWDEMIENKMQKPYTACNLTIDGKKFNEVGIRPKGNSSLTSIQGDRISFRFDFDHYVKNQDCYGLEHMVANNLQADATYMKDYIAYDLMQYMGVDAPLHTYANLSLNGEPFGVYLLCEVYEEDYLERLYDDTTIRLYSVKSSGLDEFENAVVDAENARVVQSEGVEKSSGGMGGPGGPPPPGGGMPPPPPPGMGGGQMGDVPPPPPSIGGEQMSNVSPQAPDMNGEQVGNVPPPPPGMDGEQMGNMPPPPGGMGGGGDLVYIDDSTSSYQTIFANAVFDNTTAEDNAKVIRAIKYLNDENVTTVELEEYWDVDKALRYLAVHTFMVNGDSYYGNMKQNYFLMEQDGKITILPWDYNLSFGTFGGGPGGEPGGPSAGNVQRNDNTTEVINSPIDTPLIGVNMEDRPLVSVLLSVDEYKERYHQYLKELAEYASGVFIDKLTIINDEISPYIQKEQVTFFDYEQHQRAFDVLDDFLKLRSESIIAQIEGRIPSTTEGQSIYPGSLLVADFSIDEMGSMGGHGGGPPGPPPMGDMQGNQPPMNGEGMAPPMGGPGGMPPNMQNGENMQGMPPPPPPGMPGMSHNQNSTGYYITIIVSMMILCMVFVGANLFKRKY